VVVLPYLNAAQAAHPALPASVAFLRAAGIPVLLGGDGFTPSTATSTTTPGPPPSTHSPAAPRRTASGPSRSPT
jgi:hypothetical protein